MSNQLIPFYAQNRSGIVEFRDVKTLPHKTYVDKDGIEIEDGDALARASDISGGGSSIPPTIVTSTQPGTLTTNTTAGSGQKTYNVKMDMTWFNEEMRKVLHKASPVRMPRRNVIVVSGSRKIDIEESTDVTTLTGGGRTHPSATGTFPITANWKDQDRRVLAAGVFNDAIRRPTDNAVILQVYVRNAVDMRRGTPDANLGPTQKQSVTLISSCTAYGGNNSAGTETKDKANTGTSSHSAINNHIITEMVIPFKPNGSIEVDFQVRTNLARHVAGAIDFSYYGWCAVVGYCHVANTDPY